MFATTDNKLVLSIIHPPVFGGPHNQMLQLNEPLAELGWNTLVVLPTEAGNGAERLRSGGVSVVQIPLHRLRAKPDPRIQLGYILGLIPEINSLRQLIRQSECDVVQICGLMNPHGAIAARLENKPIVWQLLGTTAPKLLRFLLMPLVTRLAHVVMTTGYQVAKLHPGALNAADRLVVFFPPVDTQVFCPNMEKRAQARCELGIQPDEVLVGTVGNFNKLKGHDVFVKAAAEIYRQEKSARFRVLGTHTPTHENYYKRNVVEYAESLGMLKDNVLSFYEPGNRVHELLGAFDIFLLSSRAEGIPTVLIEAMACGIPIVSTNVGAVSEIIDNGVNGFVVPHLSEKHIVENIRKLIASPATRETISKKAREYAVNKYDIEISAKQHCEAYQIAQDYHSKRKIDHKRLGVV